MSNTETRTPGDNYGVMGKVTEVLRDKDFSLRKEIVSNMVLLLQRVEGREVYLLDEGDEVPQAFVLWIDEDGVAYDCRVSKVSLEDDVKVCIEMIVNMEGDRCVVKSSMGDGDPWTLSSRWLIDIMEALVYKIANGIDHE